MSNNRGTQWSEDGGGTCIYKSRFTAFISYMVKGLHCIKRKYIWWRFFPTFLWFIKMVCVCKCLQLNGNILAELTIILNALAGKKLKFLGDLGATGMEGSDEFRCR